MDQELQNLKAQYAFKLEELRQAESDKEQISVKMRRTIDHKQKEIEQIQAKMVLPVDTDWDLGVGDSTAIWFSQSLRSGEVRLIDYYEASGAAGGACMGADPRSSVVNKFSQLHDAANVFVTDGAQMSSSACQNPSLTYMALSARAADHAVQLLQEGVL